MCVRCLVGASLFPNPRACSPEHRCETLASSGGATGRHRRFGPKKIIGRQGARWKSNRLAPGKTAYPERELHRHVPAAWGHGIRAAGTKNGQRRKRPACSCLGRACGRADDRHVQRVQLRCNASLDFATECNGRRPATFLEDLHLTEPTVVMERTHEQAAELERSLTTQLKVWWQRQSRRSSRSSAGISGTEEAQPRAPSVQGK